MRRGEKSNKNRNGGTFSPAGRRKREQTEIGRSVLKTGEHPLMHTLFLFTLPHFLLPTCPRHPPPLVSCIPPSLGKQGQQISLLFSAGPGEEDTWTTLRVSAWSSHGPLLPLPLSVDKEAVIVPAPVSEEIGKSDGFVSHRYDNRRKEPGAN